MGMKILVLRLRSKATRMILRLTTLLQSNSRLLAVCDGIDIYRSDEEKLECVIHLPVEERSYLTTHVDLASYGKVVVSGGDDGKVRLWVIPSGSQMPSLVRGSGNYILLLSTFALKNSGYNPPQIVKV
jgi:WD40 repeat protein